MPDWYFAGRPGFAGGKKRSRDADRDALFGAGLWRTRHLWQNRVLERAEALELYEEAYFRHFQKTPGLIDWLCAAASEVYDNEPSNVESGLDYSKQETRATHLQDIAVRRVLRRMARVFEGDHLVQIRGRKSEGFRLNPGEVPFHEPEHILQPSLSESSWFKKDSVEDFWQSNKILEISAKVHPDLLKRWALPAPGAPNF